MADSNNIINLFSRALTQPSVVQQTTAVKPVANGNPFNPFVTKSENMYDNYAKNKPVKGGYFAGYYNNKPNVVGQRLFIEA